MGKGKGHVDRKRKEMGNQWHKDRVNELIKENKNSPVRYYNIESPGFEIYRPGTGKGKRKK